MSDVAPIVAWARDELVEYVKLTPAEADEAMRLCVDRLVERVGDRELAPLLQGMCLDAVMAARSTPLGGGPEWWRTTGLRAYRLLLDGQFNEAQPIQAEALAGHFDVDVDPNWPDYKMFKNVPPGAAVGDVLRLGNGEGWRADAVVVERDGAIGIEIIEGTQWEPWWDLWDEAWNEAERFS